MRIAAMLAEAGAGARSTRVIRPPAVTDRERVAHYEAGHAVIVGLPILSVTIMAPRAETAIDSVPLGNRHELVSHVRAQVALAWGGVCSELILTGERQPRLAWASASGDMDDALQWARLLYPDVPSADRYVDAMQARVTRALAARWRHVQRIAHTLLRHRTLKGARLARLTATGIDMSRPRTVVDNMRRASSDVAANVQRLNYSVDHDRRWRPVFGEVRRARGGARTSDGRVGTA
jgi:hypothetical protein